MMPKMFASFRMQILICTCLCFFIWFQVRSTVTMTTETEYKVLPSCSLKPLSADDRSLVISRPMVRGIGNFILVFSTQYAMMKDYNYQPYFNTQQLEALSEMFDMDNLIEFINKDEQYLPKAWSQGKKNRSSIQSNGNQVIILQIVWTRLRHQIPRTE